MMRLLVWVGCLVLGAAAGLAAVLVHERWWGLLLGLGAEVLRARVR